MPAYLLFIYFRKQLIGFIVLLCQSYCVFSFTYEENKLKIRVYF